MIEDLPQDTLEFYERHCAMPGGVVIAFCYSADGDEMVSGVFSSLEKASEWVATHQDEGSVIFSPYVIDQPEYGNVPHKELN